MMDDYFDVDAILRDEERVPVEFNTQAHNLGYLDPASDSPDLEPGAALELPLWLAAVLANRNIVDVSLPRVFTGRTRQALIADAPTVALRDKGAFYYEIGVELAELVRPPNPPLVQLLRTVLAKRYAGVLDISTNSLGQDTTYFTRQLTNLERNLFEAGYWNTSAFYAWKTRRMEKLTTSSIMRPPKRKRGRS